MWDEAHGHNTTIMWRLRADHRIDPLATEGELRMRPSCLESKHWHINVIGSAAGK